MRKEWHITLLLGAVVPLLAMWFYWGSDLAPAVSEPSSVEAPSATPKTISKPAPSEPSLSTEGSDDAANEMLARPESEELYWEELERLEREDKQRALDYALAGEQWYGDEGRPAEARRAKIVTLLVDAGKMEEARRRTHAFIAKYPHSSYRRLVQGVTGIHPRPGAPPH